MNPGHRPPDLLDTSVIVHLARGSATGVRIEADLKLTQRPDRPLFSTFSEGELLGFARYRDWQASKVASLTELLQNMVRVEAGLPEVVDAYADLYAMNRRQGLNLGINDLWIAATAKAANARLLTCDRDFERIPNAWLDCLWIDPMTGNNWKLSSP